MKLFYSILVELYSLKINLLKGMFNFVGETVSPPRPAEKLPPFLRMYLGGAPVNVTSLEKFGGCIRGFKIGDRLLDLQKNSQSVEGIVQLESLKHVCLKYWWNIKVCWKFQPLFFFIYLNLYIWNHWKSEFFSSWSKCIQSRQSLAEYSWDFL